MNYGTRFNNHAQTALTIDAIRNVAPSAFAENKHESRSARYTYIPTIEVINGLIRNGFQPFSAVQSTARDESKKNFTKHMIRFRRQEDKVAVGDSLPEVVLINSHDGTSAYKLFAGIFRLICTNGLVVADGTVSSISVSHKGNIVDRVIEGSIEIIGNTGKAIEKSREWSGLQLSSGEQQAFARAALELRFPSEQVENYDGDQVTRAANTIRPDQLLQPRRYDDNGNDLWKTFNRVQENVVRGNLRGRTIDAETGRTGRKIRTREVTGINQNVGLNRALWTLTEEMARLKAA